MTEPERETESELLDRLRQHFDLAADGAGVPPARTADPAAVHRKLGRQQRTRRALAGIASVAAIAVVAVLAWPTPSVQQVAVPKESAEAQRARERAAEIARLSGGRPDVVGVVDRETSDGLRIMALLVDRSLDPSAGRSFVPERCRDDESADVVVQVPSGGFGRTQVGIGQVKPGDVWLGSAVVYGSVPDGSTTLPNGAVDPRMVFDPAPGAQPQVTPSGGPVAGLVVARGDASLRSIRATWADGSTDDAEVVDGFVVLVVPYRQTGSLDYPFALVADLRLTFAGGREVTIDTSGGPTWIVGPGGEPTSARSTQAIAAGECEPIPLSLPPPGRGPADEAAARAAVVDAIETAAKGALPIDDRLRAFVDRDRGRRIVEELGAAKVAGAADSSATVTGVVFVSPTEAVVQFDLHLPPAIDGTQIPPSFVTGVFGKVVLRRGAWQITSESVCRLLASITRDACAGLSFDNYPPEVYADR